VLERFRQTNMQRSYREDISSRALDGWTQQPTSLSWCWNLWRAAVTDWRE